MDSRNKAAVRPSAPRARLAKADRALLSECALFDLRRASRSLTALYDQHLRATGLSSAQYSLMRNIAALEPVSINGLAQAMLMDRTSVTRVLAPLAAGDLLVIEAGTDRRIKRVRLTRTGRAAIARSESAWLAAQAALYDAIGREQWLKMRDALRTTVRLLRSGNDPSGTSRRRASVVRS